MEAHRYPQRDRKQPTYTYPVVQEQSKHKVETVTTDATTDEESAEPAASTNDELPNDIENEEDTKPLSKPKGSLKTTFYGVKKPSTNTDKK